MKIFLIIAICASLVSCGSNHYSPLDNYINAVNNGAKVNDSMRVAAKNYIDSVKGAHIVIHNKTKFF